MCPCVGQHAPSFGWQHWWRPSRLRYLSPQGILLRRVYGTTASRLWLELRGPAARQATPSWTVYRLACHRLLPWLRVTFAMVPDAAWPGSDQRPWGTAPAAGPLGRLGCPSVPDPCSVFCCCRSLGRPRCARLCGVLGPLGSSSPLCSLRALCCVCGVLGHFAPVHRCARSVCCITCAVSSASCLLFTNVLSRCIVMRVRCPGTLGSCSPRCSLGVSCCICGVLGQLAPDHRCAGSVRWVACVRCPGPLDSCSPVFALGVLCRVCDVLGNLAPVHPCAGSVCRVASAVCSAIWLLFTGVLARCVVLRERCPEPLGSCSPVCPLRVLFRVRPALSHLAPVHRCVPPACCVACAVSWATWLQVTGVLARRVVLRARCPGQLGSCSPPCPLGALCCVCGVWGHLAPVHRCARSACCIVSAVSWATWLLCPGAHAWCVVLCVRCPGPLCFCSPRCTFVCCVVCAVS